LIVDARNETDWPAEALRTGAAAAALRWVMPHEVGGEELAPLDLHRRYERLARESLPLALIVSQRDSAVGVIDASPNQKTRRRLLGEVRDGAFVTVGIAQLTTSHQTGAPALTATRTDTGYRINGLIPWATGAAKARYIVAGACTDAGQILFALPTDLPGVTIDPPLPLVSMRSTWTAQVRCEQVEVPPDLLLLGPAPNVLSLRRKSVPIPQAFLAVGHCWAALDLISSHASDRARAIRRRFDEQLDSLHARVIASCDPDGGGADPEEIAILRGEANDLAVRITTAAVALYKGSALLTSHPAQRLAREALFLLVWSCPDPVIDCTTELLSNGRS
jgi:alkylation response protein AidB-like acyl-CoA dehydrogenase